MTKVNRTFQPHDGYFDVEEHFDGEFYRRRTRIIVTGNAMGASKGLQIIRFARYLSEEVPDAPWKYAGNSYAGVYLLPEEWEQVFSAIRQAATNRSTGGMS